MKGPSERDDQYHVEDDGQKHEESENVKTGGMESEGYDVGLEDDGHGADGKGASKEEDLGKNPSLASAMKKVGSVTKDGATSCFGLTGRSAREFRDFMLLGHFVELAVAFVLGSAFEQMISSLVAAFITPLISMAGGTSFEKLAFTLRRSEFRYGLFIDRLISFITIAAVVFYIVVVPAKSVAERLSPPRVMRNCPYCFTPIVIMARRCRFCTSMVDPPRKSGRFKEATRVATVDETFDPFA